MEIVRRLLTLPGEGGLRNDMEEWDLEDDIMGRNCADAGPAMMTTRFAYSASGKDMTLRNVLSVCGRSKLLGMKRRLR